MGWIIVLSYLLGIGISYLIVYKKEYTDEEKDLLNIVCTAWPITLAIVFLLIIEKSARRIFKI